MSFANAIASIQLAPVYAHASAVGRMSAPPRDTWRKVDDIPMRMPVHSHAAVVMDQHIWIIGGRTIPWPNDETMTKLYDIDESDDDDNPGTRKVLAYDTEGGSWLTMPSLPKPVIGTMGRFACVC